MPLPSPTTTRAVKLKRRPPFTTLATRLIFTTRSMYETPLSAAPPRRSSRRSRRSPPVPPPRRGAAAISGSSSQHLRSLELEPAFTGAVRQSGDAPGVAVATAVEDDSGDARLLGPLSEELADLLRLLGLVRLERAQRGVHGGRAHQRVADRVVHDLDEHVTGRAVDDQARTLGRTNDLLADTAVTAGPRDGAGGRAPAERSLRSHAYLPAFPTLRRICSPW